MAQVRLAPSPPYTHQDYPKVVYHPETGKTHIAKDETDVPRGYLDRHPADVRAKVAVASHSEAPAPKTNGAAHIEAPPPQASPDEAVGVYDGPPRAEVIAALRKKNLKFNARASTPALWAILRG